MSLLTRRQFIGAATGLAVVGPRLALPATALTINPRSSWATNRPPKGPMNSEDVKFLIVHHSASRNGHTGADAPGILRSFYDFHTSPEKGWNDIAYNFLIDADGGVWEGRAGSLDGPVAGDATGGNQGFSQLVCIIGDYNTAHPSHPSLGSLILLLAWLAARDGVSTAPGAEVTFTSEGSNRWPAGTEVTTPTITGHRTMSKTTCPGENLNDYVIGGLIADVEAVRGGAPPPTTSSTSTSTTSTTASTSTTMTTVAPTTAPTPPLSSTTTVPPVVTTSPPPPTTLPTDTTLPEAVGPIVASGNVGLLIGAGAMIVTGVGLVAWRYRRMG